MRYQNDIVERLRQGIAAVNREVSDQLVNELSKPHHNLSDFAQCTNQFYTKLLGTNGANQNAFSIPENTDAIPFWIEDLESAVLPVLRVAGAMR